MMRALDELTTQKTAGEATKYVAYNVVWFLYYVATYSSARIRYHASGMVLHKDNDSSHLSVRNTRSQACGHFLLSNVSINPLKPSLKKL